MKKTILYTALAGAQIGLLSAASIAVNFIENAANQGFAGGTNIGPTSINSSNWNNTIDFDTGTLANGGFNAGSIKDDSGATVAAATLTWTSPNVYYNGAGTAGDEARLFVGYLDDGGAGNSFTLSNHGYAQYDVYILATGDAGNGTGGTATFTHGEMTVNGVNVGTHAALGYNGGTWVESTGGTNGNYIVFSGQTAANLTVSSTNVGGRGPVNGFIIVDTTPVPEPSSAALLGLGGLALILRRRK
ncbi:MAG: PEP-CTERM sorting domain-containing protein [Akkermansiaceae bacterium]